METVRRRRRWLGLALLIGAWSANPLGAQVRDRNPAWTAPAKHAALTNPLWGREDALPGGRRVFEERCSPCHGANAQGSPKAPNLVASDVQAQSDGSLFWKVSTGDARSGMPAFSFLPPVQRWQLVLYLRAVGMSPSGSRPAS